MHRFNYARVAPGAYEAMSGLEKYLRDCGLEAKLLHLIKLRAWQNIGCAFCLDMHSKDLAAIGDDAADGLARCVARMPVLL
jgi:AhpD family alkylhydroperoxidase